LIAKDATAAADEEDDLLEMEHQFQAHSTAPAEGPRTSEPAPSGGHAQAPAVEQPEAMITLLENPAQDKGKQKEHTPPREPTPEGFSRLPTLSPICITETVSPGPSTLKRRHVAPAMSNVIDDGEPLSEVEEVEEPIKKKRAHTGARKVSTNKGGRGKK
jgi:hypothetical protein